MSNMMKKVLIVGSAPDAVRVTKLDTSFFTHTIAINNAWKVFSSWDILIHPDDFPAANRPLPHQHLGKKIITSREFVPIQNQFGGFVYAGGTMSFTAGYWALGALQPDVIAYLGCDMIYDARPNFPSHFYGRGSPDPLREDVTLQSLEAKSMRLLAIARKQGCVVVNLSELEHSRMLIPRMGIDDIKKMTHRISPLPINNDVMQLALDTEAALGYWVLSGRYWEHLERFDKAKLRHIDSLWLSTSETAVSNSPPLKTSL